MYGSHSYALKQHDNKSHNWIWILTISEGNHPWQIKWFKFLCELFFVTLWIVSSCYKAAPSYWIRKERTCCCSHTFGMEWWLQMLVLSLLIELVLRIATRIIINISLMSELWWNRGLVLPRSKEFIHPPSLRLRPPASADFTRYLSPCEILHCSFLSLSKKIVHFYYATVSQRMRAFRESEMMKWSC